MNDDHAPNSDRVAAPAGSRGRWLIPTDCRECVLDIDADAGSVVLSLLPTHVYEEQRSWRGRISNALLALRGGSWPYIEFVSKAEVYRINQALLEAAEEAWKDEKQA